MNISIEIEPSEYVTAVKVIDHIKLQVLDLVLFQSVTIMVILCDINDCPIDTKIIRIEEDEYVMWSNDDNYLMDLVLAKLGLSKKSIEVPIEIPIEIIDDIAL